MRGRALAVFFSVSSTLAGLFLVVPFAAAQTPVTIDANTLVQKANVYFSPRSGTFQEDSSFEVPIFLDTQGKGVNTIQLFIKFDPNKLQVISPAGRNSIITLWVEPPSYSNTDGTIKFVGVVPGGINTDSGLIATITFKALAAGDTRVSLTSESQILANDGIGTVVRTDFGSALYTVLTKPPEGVRVFSDTHPDQDKWYNNNSVVLQWEKPPGITEFSYVVDDKPNTVPDNTPETGETLLSLTTLREGVSYFHLKALKNGVWGGTTTYVLHIDTTPPAEFKPTAEMYAAAIVSSKALVTFFTTDALSGVDHYEVGTINKSDSADISPAFLEAQSPYTVPTQGSSQMRVIVRAFDKAGNVRDGSIDITLHPTFLRFLQAYSLEIILILVLLLLLILVSRHYLFRHHVLGRLKKAFRSASEDDDAPPPIIPTVLPPGASDHRVVPEVAPTPVILPSSPAQVSAPPPAQRPQNTPPPPPTASPSVAPEGLDDLYN